MIKPLLLAALVAAPMAHANEKLEGCEKIGNLAVGIYDMRQSNVPADVAFSVNPDNSVWVDMVHDAYTKPRWNTQKRRDENRVDFKSKWVLYCYEVNNANNH